MLVDNTAFILALEKLAISARGSSSFTVNFKRWDGHQKPKPREGKPPLPQPKEYLCLMRAQMKSKKVPEQKIPGLIKLV
ncbi:SRP14 family protein [Megaselia abdita]